MQPLSRRRRKSARCQDSRIAQSLASWSSFRRSGNRYIQRITIATLPTTPKIVAGIRPNKDEVMPDSNSPSWFDVPMKSELTALTRPRISSGVYSCSRKERTTTLTTSALPSTARMNIDSQSKRESAKAIVASPKTMTAPNMRMPAWRLMGLRARTTYIVNAPARARVGSGQNPKGLFGGCREYRRECAPKRPHASGAESSHASPWSTGRNWRKRSWLRQERAAYGGLPNKVPRRPL